jgi:hypothetical protein
MASIPSLSSLVNANWEMTSAGSRSSNWKHVDSVAEFSALQVPHKPRRLCVTEADMPL